jgi:hypothetical protein
LMFPTKAVPSVIASFPESPTTDSMSVNVSVLAPFASVIWSVPALRPE